MMQKLYDRMSVLSEKEALLISGFIKSFITKECVSESSFNNLFSTDSLTSKVAFTYKFSAYLPPHPGTLNPLHLLYLRFTLRPVAGEGG
jgi:hypothetical protein